MHAYWPVREQGYTTVTASSLRRPDEPGQLPARHTRPAGQPVPAHDTHAKTPEPADNGCLGKPLQRVLPGRCTLIQRRRHPTHRGQPGLSGQPGLDVSSVWPAPASATCGYGPGAGTIRLWKEGRCDRIN
jgi:hypothetical protein